MEYSACLVLCFVCCSRKLYKTHYNLILIIILSVRTMGFAAFSGNLLHFVVNKFLLFLSLNENQVRCRPTKSSDSSRLSSWMNVVNSEYTWLEIGTDISLQ